MMPAAAPRVVVHTVYPLADDLDQADSRVGLPGRVRGAGPDPRDALDLIDAVFDKLHGATHLDLPACWYISSSAPPRRRWAVTRTAATSTPTLITFIAHRPTKHHA